MGIPSVIGFYWTELIYYGLIGQGYGYNERGEFPAIEINN